MSGFNNPIIGGGGGLVYPSIHSPNFVTGSAGWSVNKDGSAEFNNVVIRNGQVVSGTVLVYSGAPAFGNLVASIAAGGGTDTFGNAYIGGITSYSSAGGFSAVAETGAVLNLYTAPGAGGPWTQVGQISTGSGDLILNSNRHTLSIVPLYVSSAVSGDVVQITCTTNAPTAPILEILANAAGDNTFGIRLPADTNARLKVDSNGVMHWGPGNATQDTDLYRGGAGILQTDSTFAITNQATPGALAGAAQLYAASGQPAYRNPAGLLNNLSGANLATVNIVAVTQAAFSNLTQATIPAADAEVGATYEITATGFGTWGSTQQQLTFGARFGAAVTNVVGITPVIASTALAASAAFQWKATVRAVCVTTGATGTWRVNITGTITQTANAILPGTAADNTIPFVGGTGPTDITLDTTVAEILGISAKWAATTGAPTISKIESTFARIA